MNERIGKLAVEAGAHWDHGDWNMPSAVYFSEGDLEKFAELIVKECARVYWNIDDGEIHSEYVKALKEHFGVEE
jgi:hypothetical protein